MKRVSFDLHSEQNVPLYFSLSVSCAYQVHGLKPLRVHNYRDELNRTEISVQFSCVARTVRSKRTGNFSSFQYAGADIGQKLT